MKFQSFFLFASFMLLSLTAVFAQSADEAAIKKVIEAETAAWHAGDLKAQMACWQVQAYSRAIISAGGGAHYDLSAEMMKNLQPLTPTGATSTNTNYLISVKGDMAWSSHDQVNTEKNGSKTFSHEMRILEKIGGTWKIVGMSVHFYQPQ